MKSLQSKQIKGGGVAEKVFSVKNEVKDKFKCTSPSGQSMDLKSDHKSNKNKVSENLEKN